MLSPISLGCADDGVGLMALFKLKALFNVDDADSFARLMYYIILASVVAYVLSVVLFIL